MGWATKYHHFRSWNCIRKTWYVRREQFTPRSKHCTRAMAIPPSWVRFLDGYTKLYMKMDENGVMTILKYGYIMAYHPISEKKNGETYAKQTHTYPTYIPWNPYFLSGWCPPVIGWFRNSINKFVISTINHRIQPLISQLNAIERGPHPVHWHRFWVPSQAPTLGMLKTR